MLHGLVVSRDNVKIRAKVTRSMKIKYSFLLCPGKLLFSYQWAPSGKNRGKEEKRANLIFLSSSTPGKL